MASKSKLVSSPQQRSWKAAKRVIYKPKTFYSKIPKAKTRASATTSAGVIETAEKHLSLELVQLFEKYGHLTSIQFEDYSKDETMGDFTITFREKDWKEFCECSAGSLVKDHFAALLNGSDFQGSDYYDVAIRQKLFKKEN